MPPFRLVIPRVFHEEMLRHARATLPNECCGLLAGTVENGRGFVRARHPLVNELASPVAYRSDARSMFAAMKAMRAAGTDVLAVYHSHPTSPAIPSRRDLAENYSPQVIEIIVGLSELPDVRGWWLTETSYTAAELEIGPANGTAGTMFATAAG